MHRLSTVLGAAVAVFFFSGLSALADFIPWSYTSSIGPALIPSDGGPSSGINATGVTTSPTFPNSTDGVLLATFAPFGSPSAKFTNSPFNITMTITDQTSGASKDIPLSGFFTGTLNTGGSDLDTKLNKPVAQTVTIGKNEYTVAFGLYTPPSPGKSGSIGANVIVVGSGPPIVPEPASVLLATMGLSALGLRCWWRRKDVSPQA